MLEREREPVIVIFCCYSTNCKIAFCLHPLDVDEFVSINADVVSHAQELFRQPGSILHVIKRYSDPTNRTTIPTPPGNSGNHDNTAVTVAKENEYWFKHFQQSCCITLPRVLYGAVESTDEEIAQGVPTIFAKNAKQFDTLRWRYRTTSPRGMSDGRKYFAYDL